MSLFYNAVSWRVSCVQDEIVLRPQRIGKLARRSLKQKITGTGPFDGRIRGSRKFGFRGGDIAKVMSYCERVMPHFEVGQAVEITDAEGKTWLVRKTRERLRLPIKDTAGNSDIDRIYTWVVSRYTVSNMGICNRRAIAGTNSWSQHSPWGKPNPGSNAWDIGCSVKLGNTIAKDLVKHAKDLHVGRVIHNRMIWDPKQGWHPYTGVDPHTSHIHVEGSPERQGTPLKSC